MAARIYAPGLTRILEQALYIPPIATKLGIPMPLHPNAFEGIYGIPTPKTSHLLGQGYYGKVYPSLTKPTEFVIKKSILSMNPSQQSEAFWHELAVAHFVQSHEMQSEQRLTCATVIDWSVQTSGAEAYDRMYQATQASQKALWASCPTYQKTFASNFYQSVLAFERYQGTLEEYAASQHKISPKNFLENAVALFKTLQIFHQNNLQHADLHNNNIMYKQLADNSFEFAMIDFGSSYQVKRLPYPTADMSQIAYHLNTIARHSTNQDCKTIMLDFSTYMKKHPSNLTLWIQFFENTLKQYSASVHA